MKKTARVFSLFLVWILIISVFSGSILTVNAYSESVTTGIDGVNINRGENYMVVYDNCGSYTNTNEWGYEVTVTAGVVTSMGGNNSYIPNQEGSFVVSGHGAAISWLQSNVVLGMKASYTRNTVTFTYDNSTRLKNLKINIDLMQSAYDSAAETYRIIDYSSLSARINKVKDKFDEIEAKYNADSSYDLITESEPLLAEINEITGLCIESKSVEIRGVWIRPTQTTTAEVEDYVQELYDAGINMVCIETLYNSTMIMPMPKDSLFEQNPIWAGFDMLQAFIDACHKRKMELHLWLPVYYVGHGGSSNYDLSVGAKKPEWLSLNNEGSYFDPNDWNRFMLLSPANPEVKEFLLETYEYILKKYDVDGFQLDYIRYTARGITDFGYDKVTVNAFKEKYGVTPYYNTDESFWDDWVAFRAGFVTDMVKSVRELVDRVSPEVVLSADVSPEYYRAYYNIYQDSLIWLENGYLDMVHPMAYGEGYVNLMEDYTYLAPNCYLGVGLGAYMDAFDSEDMLRQASEMSSINAEGSVFFEAKAFLSKCELLTSTLYRNRALSPTYDEKTSVLLLAQQAEKRIDEAILPLGGMTDTEAQAVKTELKKVIASANNGLTEQVITDINSAIAEVKNIKNSSASKALADDLFYAKMIAGKMVNTIPKCFKKETLNGKDIMLGFNPYTVKNLTVETAKTLFEGNITVTDKKGNVLPDNSLIGTGCVISDGENSYTVVIKGDVNGDGEINSVDYLMTKRIFLGTYSPDAFQNRAASITDSVSPNSFDYLKIKRHFLGTYDIFS